MLANVWSATSGLHATSASSGANPKPCTHKLHVRYVRTKLGGTGMDHPAVTVVAAWMLVDTTHLEGDAS